MKKIILISILLFGILACNNEYSPRDTVQITIEKFKMDSSSIRAIEILNDTTLVYAGSMGVIGSITDSGKINSFKKIVRDTIVPHFRAIAHTKQTLYALSIGNPALLYQYKNDEIELVYKEENDKVFYDSMKFWDDLNGIAMGDPTSNCLSILITRDGGNSWSKIDCDYLPKVEDGEAAFAASNTNIAVVGENAWIVTGGLKARIFHSPDMGLTWKVYETPIIQGKNTTGIYSVDFINESDGIICGGDYTNKFGTTKNKAITNDGGKTWKVVGENSAPKYVSCVQYVPDTNGKEVFAVSTNGIFYSKDSGYSWAKLSDESYYSIRIVSKNKAWLSGNEIIAKMTIN